MTFSDFKYERPQLEKVCTDIRQLLKNFNTYTAEEQIKKLENIVALRNYAESMMKIAAIRHSIDTTDPFYKAEKDHFDEVEPEYGEVIHEFYQTILASPHQETLKQEFGRQFFDLASNEVRGFSPDIIEDLKQENYLCSEYARLVASAKIEFRGEVYNLSQLQPFEVSSERQLRKEAANARFDFFADNKEKFDEIFDKLVKVRHRIARKLRFENFIELGYIWMQRIGYGRQEVEAFRKGILDTIVPVVNELKEEQEKRLGVKELKFYDDPVLFSNGNAKPAGDPEWILNRAAEMYTSISPETGAFFREMSERGLMDLVTKKGKESGGYCDYIPALNAPFIFSNFNGTSSDIDVLTHEAGHAFQAYTSRSYTIPEYHFPTTEACEIHSMSMEFFCWPYMDLFFNGEAEKYRYHHLITNLYFLPYGAAVDEFQHWVYENPEATPDERHTAWKHVEQKYLPHKDYDGNHYLANGGFWQKQSHIYQTPFYYIDYALASVCAFQFWLKDQKNHDHAWQEYLLLCKKGGSKNFPELVAEANLKPPFDKDILHEIAMKSLEWLKSVDVAKL